MMGTSLFRGITRLFFEKRKKKRLSQGNTSYVETSMTGIASQQQLQLRSSVEEETREDNCKKTIELQFICIVRSSYF